MAEQYQPLLLLLGGIRTQWQLFAANRPIRSRCRSDGIAQVTSCLLPDDGVLRRGVSRLSRFNYLFLRGSRVFLGPRAGPLLWRALMTVTSPVKAIV